MNIGIIILAAGSSTRMGKSKQLLPVDEGEALLHSAVRTALQSKASVVVVVLGANAKDHRQAIKDLRVDVVENRDWQSGMGSSLKAGLRYITAKTGVSGVIIMVCDQPVATSQHLDELIRTYEEMNKAVVASHYSGAPGVPALIGRELFDELMEMEDAHGAKKVIQAHLNDTALVALPGGEIDLDTPDDYQNYISRK